MNGWVLAAIGLTSFGLAWAVDTFLGTPALVIFSLAMVIGPILVLEGVRQTRRRPGRSAL